MIYVDVKKKLNTAEGILEAHFELEIKDKEFLTLFGPSGAGKTTLMRLIAGLEKPDSGSISVDGEVWFDSSKKINLTPQKRSVGFVFQDYALFPAMSVRENLLYALESPKDRHFVDTLLEMIELEDLADRLPATLSGGQKQRVALTRALVQRPKILLLDEPLSALDPAMRQKLQDEIAQVHKRLGVTSLLVSHDIAETIKLSHRLASVESGKIMRVCDPMDYFAHSKLSGKLQLVGEIVKVEFEAPIAIVTLLVESSVVQTVLTQEEGEKFRVGEHAIIAVKAFNPIVLPLRK